RPAVLDSGPESANPDACSAAWASPSISSLNLYSNSEHVIAKHLLAGNSPPAQAVGQLGSRSMQPGLYRADRTRDRHSDLLVHEILLVEKNEHETILGAKRAKS